MDKNLDLKIGLIGPFPPPYGGMANQAKQLFELLRREQLYVKFVQTNEPYRPKIIGRLKGIRAVFRIIPFILNTWNLARSVDVIHVFSNSGWAWQLFSTPVVWIGWLKKKPVIVNYRGGEAKQYFDRSIDRVRPTLKKANSIIVPSGYLKSIFSDFGFNAQIIPNIINLERFTPKNSSQLKFHLIVARNLEPIYGINIAIQAVGLIKIVYPQIRLSIAGSGPQKSELRNMVKDAGLEKNIIFTGKLNPDEIVDLFHSADIMLNPSSVDNMPNAILESMACGVPVVTTNAGGIPFMVKSSSTASIVKINDPEEMAKAVIELYQDPELYATIARNGIEEVKRYAWTEVKQEWLTLYQRLAK